MSEKTNREDEVVVYIVVRADLNMPVGKTSAQVGHAVHLMLRKIDFWNGGSDREIPEHNDLKNWTWEWETKEGASYTKISLRADSAETILALHDRVWENKFISAKVVDEGRTVVAPNTVTAICLQPMPRSVARQFVGDLKPL